MPRKMASPQQRPKDYSSKKMLGPSEFVIIVGNEDLRLLPLLVQESQITSRVEKDDWLQESPITSRVKMNDAAVRINLTYVLLAGVSKYIPRQNE